MFLPAWWVPVGNRLRPRSLARKNPNLPDGDRGTKVAGPRGALLRTFNGTVSLTIFLRQFLEEPAATGTAFKATQTSHIHVSPWPLCPYRLDSSAGQVGLTAAVKSRGPTPMSPAHRRTIDVGSRRGW